MQLNYSPLPRLISHPRIWIHLLGIIVAFIAWFAFYTAIGIHLLTVLGGTLISIDALRMLINFPFTLCVMPNGIVIKCFGTSREIAWDNIDFAVERGFLGNKRLIIGSHLFPNRLRIEGYLQDRRWYPVYVLWRGQHTNFDKVQEILQQQLKNKYQYSYWQ